MPPATPCAILALLLGICLAVSLAAREGRNLLVGFPRLQAAIDRITVPDAATLAAGAARPVVALAWAGGLYHTVRGHGRQSAGEGENPLQSGVRHRAAARVCERGLRLGAPLGRRRLHAQLPGVAPGAGRVPAGAADHLLHGRARDGGAAARHRRRGRGDRAQLHLRLDGERLRAARRAAGVRRHPPGHVQHGREPARGADHPAHPGDRARALRGRRLRDGPHRRDRRRGRHPGRRGQRPRAVRDVPRPAARVVRGPGHAELPRDQELPVRRGRGAR